MLIITGTIKIESEEELARVKEVLIQRAGSSRQDEGNIEYSFSVNLEDPTEVILTEKWESQALLEAHLQAPDEEFNSVMATAKIESAVVLSHEVTTETELLRR